MDTQVTENSVKMNKLLENSFATMFNKFDEDGQRSLTQS